MDHLCADVVGIVCSMLPDCRGIALTCSSMYRVYVNADDYKWWTTRNLARLLPKMYGPVWRGSICDLARAGNIEIVRQYAEVIMPYMWTEIGAAAAEGGAVDIALMALEHGAIGEKLKSAALKCTSNVQNYA